MAKYITVRHTATGKVNHATKKAFDVLYADRGEHEVINRDNVESGVTAGKAKASAPEGSETVEELGSAADVARTLNLEGAQNESNVDSSKSAVKGAQSRR